MNLSAALSTDGWMFEAELKWLAEQAQSCQTIIEVGCWKGRSTLALADNTPGQVFAVDHWKGTPGDPGHDAELAKIGREGLYQEFLRNMGDRHISGNVYVMRMSSEEAAPFFHLRSMDLVFIDAGHAYADVKRDILSYRPVVKDGGILCGHDYACPAHIGVTDAVNEVFPTVNRAAEMIWWVRL